MPSGTEVKPEAALAGCLSAILGMVLLVGGLGYETWAAMRLWSWFSPWALPFSLVQGMGMNLAACLVFRQQPARQDDDTPYKTLVRLFAFYYVSPTIALGVGACLRFLL